MTGQREGAGSANASLRPTPKSADTTAEPSAAFTPGPWIEFCDAYGETVAILPATRQGDVCAFRGPYPRREDARLIAASPDQHAAAREIDRLMLVIDSAVRNADPTHHAAVLAALKANRAAIAKATGQSGGEG